MARRTAILTAMTNTVADERKRLHDRLAELDDERGRITYALSVLDRIDPDSPSTRSTPRARQPRLAGQGSSVGRPGGSYDRAVRIVNSSDRVWRVEDLVVAMREDGWAAQVENEVDAVRSALSRAVKNGLIARPEPGFYGPVMRSGDEADGTVQAPDEPYEDSAESESVGVEG